MASRGRRVRQKRSGEAPSDRTDAELSVHEAMLEALVEELDEKGAIKYSDWEARAKRKLAELEESIEDRGP